MQLLIPLLTGQCFTILRLISVIFVFQFSFSQSLILLNLVPFVRKFLELLPTFKNRNWRFGKKLRASPDDPGIVQRYIDCTFSIKAKFNSIKLSNESKILQSKNLGAVYKHINARLTHKAGIAPLFGKSGGLVVDDLDKANLLNSQFVNICKNR